MARPSRRATAALCAGASLLLCGITAPVRGEFHADLLVSVPPGDVAVSPATAEPSPAGAEGTAAYYSKRFNGRRTTSGERYRPEKLTAAHQDLPLGTRVRVTDLRTGKEAIVRVNDRCRKRSEPFIDLSRAAAKKLGFLGKGIARVRIEPLVEMTAKDESVDTVVLAESP